MDALEPMRGIADTGFLVAFAHRNDEYHHWATGIAERVTEPLLTCEAGLAEAAFHLRSATLVFDMLQEGLVTPAFNVNDHLPQLVALARRYADRQPDLADLCLIRMSELHPRHSVITVDREDFKVYSRNKREVNPLICPPQTPPPAYAITGAIRAILALGAASASESLQWALRRWSPRRGARGSRPMSNG